VTKISCFETGRLKQEVEKALKKKMKKRVTLAIETAIGNGSLSLFENEYLIDVRSGSEKICRSDRLLPIILEFLVENKIEKRDLSLIAVSRGPGSFTGARIGLATAIGLKNGLNVSCAGISVFQALALTTAVELTNTPVIIALLSNEDNVVSVNFENFVDFENDSMAYRNQSFDDFAAEIDLINRQTNVILDKKIFEMIKNGVAIRKTHPSPIKNSLLKFNEISDDLSTYIGKAVLYNNTSDNLNILYVNSNRGFY
jgi:tRNA threonylcarbamoyl adenosine modification protein YeaZ